MPTSTQYAELIERLIEADGQYTFDGEDEPTILREAATAIRELQEDATRYRYLRRGQKWSVIDGIGDELRAEELDAAIDAALLATTP